jgi:hypothetical protein
MVARLPIAFALMASCVVIHAVGVSYAPGGHGCALARSGLLGGLRLFVLAA